MSYPYLADLLGKLTDTEQATVERRLRLIAGGEWVQTSKVTSPGGSRLSWRVIFSDGRLTAGAALQLGGAA